MLFYGEIMKTKQITKERIIDNAIALIEDRGIEFLNARSLAQYMNCSTQPIYLTFKNMEDLKLALLEACKMKLEAYLMQEFSKESNLFMGYLLAYISFAYQHPKIFEYIYMKNTYQNNESDQQMIEVIVHGIMKAGNYDYDTAYRFYIQSFVYAHGFSTQIVSGFIHWNMTEIRALMEEEFEALKLKYIIRGESNHGSN